jgi:mannose-6-phosphate isomerase-like protein (cupin superfamily)
LIKVFSNKYSLQIAQFLINLIPNLKFEICGTEYNLQNSNRRKHLNNIKDYFINCNINKIPDEEPPEESFIPTRHHDPVDGFFIQFEGSTLWTIYYKNNEKQYTLKSGDMMFIPKNLEHSVEALEPRCSVSISFTDGENAI